ncbi:MAG: hypothetical protein PHS14_03390 [Elusimicrobia bacterium]|nr:hypothetical protein [Elusimicrobiota bacterium]
MKKEKPGPQGLANLQTWRLPFSADVKHRRRQTLEDRRPHKLRGGLRPDAVLGTPVLNWTEPPRLDRSGVAVASSPKHRGTPVHEPIFFTHKVKRYRHRSLRHGKARP